MPAWYNASQLSESYYNWMTAAAVATYDLEFFIPGNAYVEHNGDAHTWPVDDKGRDLSHYKNNTFGPSKSYHIVGEYNDFFGGYYHDSQFGFGQWAPYEEMPGQKLWLWNLSRAGGIWEDLLTDTDGQYIEFQAGRLFDQYSPGATNTISQVGFDPYGMDQWREIWFPYKDIGGMVDASEHGVLNVETRDSETFIGLNALQKLNREINISVNGETVYRGMLNLAPMEVFTKTIPTDPSDKLAISVEHTELEYTNNPERNRLKRPFYPDEDLKVSQTEQLFQEALEAIEFREYPVAYKNLSALTEIDPSHRGAWVKLGELEYRKANYRQALEHANTVLRMDTYDPGANYLAGICYRKQHDAINALESLGWAARDMKFRSVSYAQMAEIYLGTKKYDRARMYAKKALDFNAHNLNALKVLALVARKQDDVPGSRKVLADISKIDALDHFATLETGFGNAQGPTNGVLGKIHNEFPEETILSLALEYEVLGLTGESIEVLRLKPEAAKNKLWLAYLLRKGHAAESSALLDEVLNQDPEFVFPYRRETVPVLEWAMQQKEDWKLKYYLAQNYIAVGRLDQGKSLLKALGTEPDADVFYRFRASMLPGEGPEAGTADHDRALELNPKDWKIWEESILFRLKHKKYGEAFALSNKAFKKFPGNYNIGLAHAKALLNTGRYRRVLKVLEHIQVLPYEHASESREIFNRAHLGVANEQLQKKNYKAAVATLERSKTWPEHIGVGKPYGPDERLQDYLLAMGYHELGETAKGEALLQGIIDYTRDHISNADMDHLYGLLALKNLGNQGELKELLAALDSSTNTGHAKNALAVALFKNQSGSLESLKADVPKEIWESINTVLKH